MKLRFLLTCMVSGISFIALLSSSSIALAQTVIDGGQTVTVPGSQASPWNIADDLFIGDTGSGTLEVTSGGVVSNVNAYIGTNTGYTGVATVNGAGSQWNSTGTLYVGYNGNGVLEITDGGLVSSAAGVLSAGSSSISTATVSGAGSQWVNSGSLSVGDRGRGTLEITGGATVSNMDGYIGNQSVGTGIVTVSGSGSHWDNSADLAVGASGEGSLIITDSGIVSDVIGIVGYQPGATGTVTVSGAGSQWNNSFNLLIGFAGEGSLIITDGGIVSDVNAVVGYQSGSTGMVTVSGVGSQWNNTGGMAVGGTGNGVLQVTGGGGVSSPFGFVGYDVTGTGVVTIDGTGSQWSNAGFFYIGYLGTGTLAVANQGDIAASDIILADDAASRGTLAIGARPGFAPTAPGTASAASIQFGTGTGTIVFNHTSSNYVFDATLNGGADNAVGSGTGLVGSGLIQAIAGRTILNADHGDFTGILQVSGTGILQTNGDMSHASASVLAGGRLEGNGIVGNTVNAGVIAPGTSIGVLTVAGDYNGNNGELHIETVLGDDASPTDKLVITGDASGSTNVVVTNLGGSGAQTANGIKIIEIGGVSPGNAFTLEGDYVTESGRQAVIGGAYAYTLQHNSPANPSDGNWYLTSEMLVMNPDTGQPEEGPRYQPGVPLYEQYPQVLAALNTVPTLQQRVGNRGWVNNNAVAAAPGNAFGTYGLWGRIEGTRTASDPARSTSMAHRDTDLWKLQTGFDFSLHQGADGSQLIGGVNVSHGTALAEIASPYGRGKVDTTGTGIGATLTWYGTGGFYVDGQAQVMWFDTDITSTTEGRKDVKGNNGHGYVLSAETGNRYQLGNGFSLTPQVQLVYSRVDFDSFTDPFNARVSLNDGDSLRGRFGVSLDHEANWVAKDGTKSRSHLYGIANLYNEFLDGTKVNVAGIGFTTRDERLWAGIGVGGTYEWANGTYAFYGNANIAGSAEHMSDNYAFGGTLGFRARW